MLRVCAHEGHERFCCLMMGQLELTMGSWLFSGKGTLSCNALSVNKVLRIRLWNKVTFGSSTLSSDDECLFDASFPGKYGCSLSGIFRTAMKSGKEQ
jgi:hypothetical protein